MRLVLTAGERKRALEAYYTHKDHTAPTTLKPPNHWMHPDASYVYINDARTERWSTFEGYKDLISNPLACCRRYHHAAHDGHTIETRRDPFYRRILAYMCRAHKWDKTRVGSSGQLEEYDDGEGDRT